MSYTCVDITRRFRGGLDLPFVTSSLCHFVTMRFKYVTAGLMFSSSST